MSGQLGGWLINVGNAASWLRWPRLHGLAVAKKGPKAALAAIDKSCVQFASHLRLNDRRGPRVMCSLREAVLY
jgi:hypothetical protein